MAEEASMSVGAGESIGFAAIERLAEEAAQVTESQARAELDKENVKEAIKNGLDGVSNQIKESKKVEEPDEEEEAEEAEEEQKEEPKKTEEVVKTLKGAVGDKSVDIPNNAVLTHKVNGKEVKVSVQELLNNYSGTVNYDTKLSLLDKEKKDFLRLKQEWDGDLAETKQGLLRMVELSKSGKPLDALKLVYELAEMDPSALYDSYISQIRKAGEEYASMTPEEKTIFELKQKNDLLAADQKAKADKAAQEAKTAQQNEQLNAIIKQNGVSNVEYLDAAKTMFENGTLKNDNTTDPVAVAQSICDFAILVRTYATIYEGIELAVGEDSELTKDEKVVSNIASLMRSGDAAKFTPKDVADIVSEVYGGKKQKTKSPAQKENSTKKVGSKRESAKSERASSEGKERAGVGFDDMVGSLG